MEVLGQSLVDMREAPDAQVVLEIAAVRAVRPDLDSGMEGLSERVSVLERSLSGASAFPRPAAASDRGADASPAAPASPATPASPESAASPPPAGDVRSRPSIGALRRSQQSAAEQTPAPPPREPEPAVAPEPVAPPAAPGTVGSPAAGLVDRDSLTEAWGDGILRALPARAKALYSAGRFVAVDEQGAHFALPNLAHRDRCTDLVPTVEAALAAHFGTPVTLVLDVDDAGPPPAPGSGPASPRRSGDAGGATGVHDAEDVDPAELMDDAAGPATDQASAAEARLLEAFPGASEVAH
jgi:DNA polymerase-3 subunit gamma/tau